MICDMMTQVREFLKKHPEQLLDIDGEIVCHYQARDNMRLVAKVLHEDANRWEQRLNKFPLDLGLSSAALLAEECAECLEAIEARNRLELLDGLADLVFVCMVAANRFELPLAEALQEVIRSNNTKKVSGERRLRDKGPNYEPPKLTAILERADNARRTV